MVKKACMYVSKGIAILGSVGSLMLCLCSCGSSDNTADVSLTGEITSEAEVLLTDETTSEAEVLLTDETTSEAEILSTDETMSEEDIISINGTFESNPDLSVVASFVYDNDTYVVVENVGDQAILNFKVAYIDFDKNGFSTIDKTDGYKIGKHDTANLMPGEKMISSWYGASGAYAVATVCYVNYADGSSWEATRIDSWAETLTSQFSVDEQKQLISELGKSAVKAESNDYVLLTDYYLEHGNRFSSDLDFNFSITNTSEQGVTNVNVFVLEFDENGFPVSVSPYDTYCLNGHQTGGTVNLGVGQSGTFADNLFISSTTTQVKAIVSYIGFQDGTEWVNPYVYEWVISNNSAYVSSSNEEGN